jgi:hypothetical protein
VSFTGIAPGQSSLWALAWLARIGAAPMDALTLVMGCSERVARDHVRRLEQAGLVKRVAMRRGDGVLVVLTRAGAVESGNPARRAPRSVRPHAWAHASGCAGASAWLELRGRAWGQRARDPRGRPMALSPELPRSPWHRPRHAPPRPHRADHIWAGREVELARKAPVRLRGICAMYAELTESDGPLAGVIYVCDRVDVTDLVTRCAVASGLVPPALSMRSFRIVLEQTYAAAASSAAAAATESA